MGKYVLFSNQQNNRNILQVLEEIFPQSMENKRAAFMPSGGLKTTKQKYIDEWEQWSKKYHASFCTLNNTSINPSEEHEKLRNSNILIISGGNTFQLLLNIRQSQFDEEILKFCHRPDTIIAGYSAGAIVLSPTIQICNDHPPENWTNNYSGLGCFNFEIMPHYSETRKFEYENYEKTAKFPVKALTDDDYIILNHN